MPCRSLSNIRFVPASDIATQELRFHDLPLTGFDDGVDLMLEDVNEFDVGNGGFVLGRSSQQPHLLRARYLSKVAEKYIAFANSEDEAS